MRMRQIIKLKGFEIRASVFLQQMFIKFWLSSNTTQIKNNFIRYNI